jgi:hypothetical protein
LFLEPRATEDEYLVLYLGPHQLNPFPQLLGGDSGARGAPVVLSMPVSVKVVDPSKSDQRVRTPGAPHGNEPKSERAKVPHPWPIRSSKRHSPSNSPIIKKL